MSSSAEEQNSNRSGETTQAETRAATWNTGQSASPIEAGLVMCLVGCLAVLGGRDVDLGGGGALAVIVLGAVVAAMWKEEDEYVLLRHSESREGQIEPRSWWQGFAVAWSLARKTVSWCSANCCPACCCCCCSAPEDDRTGRSPKDGLPANATAESRRESAASVPAPGVAVRASAGPSSGASRNGTPGNTAGVGALAAGEIAAASVRGLAGQPGVPTEGPGSRLLKSTSSALKQVWGIAQPVLFSLIGAAVDVRGLTGDVVGGAAAALAGGLALRSAVAFVCVWGSGTGARTLGVGEAAFVSIAWLPKATVQAALGPVALDAVVALLPENYDADDFTPSAGEEGADYDTSLLAGRSLLALAVLSILVTAPAGAALIAFSGPKLLQVDEGMQRGLAKAGSESDDLPGEEKELSNGETLPARGGAATAVREGDQGMDGSSPGLQNAVGGAAEEV